jgi:serine/threonine protein kinase
MKDGRVKIADLGLARDLKHGNPRSQSGSRNWMAPEMLLAQPCDSQADVFSFGCLLFEMCARRASNLHETVFRVTVMHAFVGVERLSSRKFSSSLRQLIADCTRIDPAERLTPAQLTIRPFFEKRLEAPKQLIHVIQEAFFTANASGF